MTQFHNVHPVQIIAVFNIYMITSMHYCLYSIDIFSWLGGTKDPVHTVNEGWGFWFIVHIINLQSTMFSLLWFMLRISKFMKSGKFCYTTIIFIFTSLRQHFPTMVSISCNPVSFHILSQGLCISYGKHGRPTQTKWKAKWSAHLMSRLWLTFLKETFFKGSTTFHLHFSFLHSLRYYQHL